MRRYNAEIRVDQVARYATSVHGLRLNEFDDPKVATCSSCHRAHAIRPASDPLSSVHPRNVARTCARCHSDSTYMEEYGIPTDQDEKYEASIHWEMISVEQDLSAPTCNDCHGNHGAAPPGVSWVGNTCGGCHMVMAELFEQSLHARLFPMLGAPGCAACHDNHEVVRAGDEMLGLGEEAVCSRCHQAGTVNGDRAAEMRAMIDSLRLEYDTATALLFRAESAGIEVSEAQFELTGAMTALVEARAAVHSFDIGQVEEKVVEGLEVALNASERGRQAHQELRFRRVGLALSVLIIVSLLVGLVLKIRQIEERRSGAS
jgi:predicted CXXCH cytochrome family protein